MFDRKDSNTGNNSTDWKADAFINIFLPRKDGSRMKLGFIALKGDHKEQEKILNLLRTDPTAIDRLRSKLVLEFKDLTEINADIDI